jgi:hypothetical protein
VEKIGDAAKAEAKVIQDMRFLVTEIRRLSAQDVVDADYGIALLRLIRKSIAEDLNQIQHEYLILRGLRWLVANGFESPIVWEWNPRQSGTALEPDLRGSLDGSIVVSAEASASESPVGKIDVRMKTTLEKLGQMQGEKFYFVCTEEMAKRAATKVTKAARAIRVVRV